MTTETTPEDKPIAILRTPLIHGKITSKPSTITRNVRMPLDLLQRIKGLADKRRWSVNAWIVNTLERECQPRGRGVNGKTKPTDER